MINKKFVFFFVLLIFIGVFGYFNFKNLSQEKTQNRENIFQENVTKKEVESLKKYRNPVLGIEFSYPQSYIPYLENNEYIGDQPSRFVSNENNNAIKSEIFLNLAGSLDNSSIDEIVEGSAYHKLKPFGENPIIEKLQIQGQEIRVIKPTDPQNKEREIIIELKKQIQLNNYYWKFLIIHLTGPLSDKTLELILRSLKFI
jgi:hypothetical protein